MNNVIHLIQKHPWLKNLGLFLAWSLIFAVIYAQSPLYTSNQNTYFLHGIAKTGFGYLANDWTATRPETMPVFSWLVFITYSILPSKIPFYFYYALLLGVYLFSTFGIMDQLFDIRKSKIRTIIFLVLFLLFHSAALRFLLSKLVAPEATFLFEGGVAGQRLLGQVFQPSVFGVFLILSIYLFMKRRLFWSLVPISVAIHFHPVYLLAGGLLTISYMWILFREDRHLKKALLLGLTALLLVAPALAYTIGMFSNSDPELAQQALDVLVDFRNPQHALVSSWMNWTVVVQGIMLLVGMVIVRKSKLIPILLIVTSGTVILTAIQILTGSKWLAMIFPWRVSVLLVPLGTSILLAWLVSKIMSRIQETRKTTRWVHISSIVLLAGLMAAGILRFNIELERQRTKPELPMMTFVASHKTPGELYMVPSKMEDFRLITGAPILVDFKSTPDRDADVMEWYTRIQWISWFYQGAKPCKTILEIGKIYGVTHVVAERDYRPTMCKALPIVYEDSVYRIYRLPSQ